MHARCDKATIFWHDVISRHVAPLSVLYRKKQSPWLVAMVFHYSRKFQLVKCVGFIFLMHHFLQGLMTFCSLVLFFSIYLMQIAHHPRMAFTWRMSPCFQTQRLCCGQQQRRPNERTSHVARPGSPSGTKDSLLLNDALFKTACCFNMPQLKLHWVSMMTPPTVESNLCLRS